MWQLKFLPCVRARKSRSSWVGSWQAFIALIAVIHKTQQCWGQSQEEHSPEVVAECFTCMNLQWCLSDEGMLICSTKTVKSPHLINPWGIKDVAKNRGETPWTPSLLIHSNSGKSALWQGLWPPYIWLKE